MFLKLNNITQNDDILSILRACCTCGCGCECDPKSSEKSVQTPGAKGGAGATSSSSPTSGV